MAIQEQLEILRKGVDFWNKWRNDNQGILIDLSDAYLKGFNLRSINLSKANLRGIILMEADLAGANFIEADLTGANLSGANLTRASLFKANLRKAMLFRSDMREVNIEGAIYELENMGHALNLPLSYYFHDGSGRKIELELENSTKRLREKEDELKKIAQKNAELTNEQLAQKNELETEIIGLKEEKELIENKFQTLKNELEAREKDSEDFKNRLAKASINIKNPYQYLKWEIRVEEVLFFLFLIIAIVSFAYLCRFICQLNYNDRLLNVYLDKEFNFYKLFFIISPVIFYLGICSTFLTLAFKRRQNIQNLQARRQEINHITGILSAYTTIREDEDIKHAKEFARDAISQYLKKVIGLKDSKDEKESENVDFLKSINDIKNQIIELKTDIKKGE